MAKNPELESLVSSVSKIHLLVFSKHSSLDPIVAFQLFQMIEKIEKGDAERALENIGTAVLCDETYKIVVQLGNMTCHAYDFRAKDADGISAEQLYEMELKEALSSWTASNPYPYFPYKVPYDKRRNFGYFITLAENPLSKTAKMNLN